MGFKEANIIYACFGEELAARLSFMFCPVGCIIIVCSGFKHCEQGKRELVVSLVFSLWLMYKGEALRK